MLTYISVKNFAIIENIEMTFHPGMTALTGETGAGKSLLIDAIGLLLGDRATSNIVRTGSDKAEVQGIFQVTQPKIIDILTQLDIPFDDNELVIKRQITPSNNNIIKVNNQTITLRDLRDITSKLADIHTQLDTHRLINQETYLDIIDGFIQDEMQQLQDQYHRALNEYHAQYKRLIQLEKSSQDIQERIDLMLFQQKELTNFHLDIDEEEQLRQDISKMKNFDKIYQTLQSVSNALEESDSLGVIYESQKQLKAISEMDPSYQQIQEQIETHYYELEDAFERLQDELSKLDFNPQFLEQQEDRLIDLENLQRKYRKTIPEIIEYLSEITEEIDTIEHIDDRLKEQKNMVKNAFDHVMKYARDITSKRQQTAKHIETELLSILDELELTKTRFEIQFTDRIPQNYMDKNYFLDSGIDEVDFMLSTNIGEPLKSLSKSASGGEMSRIMLGFKNLLADSLGLSLMIFDEIDTGVSGFVAYQVAKKMKGIAKTTQVIAITHIPQVAAISEHHVRIHKDVVNDRTVAQIEDLTGDKRIYEIAQMMSGDTVSTHAIESAKELLQKQ